MIASAYFLPMCLLVGLHLILPSMMGEHCLFFVLFKDVLAFIWPLASMCVQTRFAGLGSCAVIIALNRWGFSFVVVYENIACDGSSADSALD